MFLRTNDRIINLKNVSNINILKDRNRIIFNLNYCVEITLDAKKTKVISDYVYWDSINEEDLEQNLQYLYNNKYFIDNFLSKINDNGYININEISSIKLSEKKLRVIFNLSHPVTFKDRQHQDHITSEFVYVNCKTQEIYLDYINYIEAITTKGEK